MPFPGRPSASNTVTHDRVYAQVVWQRSSRDRLAYPKASLLVQLRCIVRFFSALRCSGLPERPSASDPYQRVARKPEASACGANLVLAPYDQRLWLAERF